MRIRQPLSSPGNQTMTSCQWRCVPDRRLTDYERHIVNRRTITLFLYMSRWTLISWFHMQWYDVCFVGFFVAAEMLCGWHCRWGQQWQQWQLLQRRHVQQLNITSPAIFRLQRSYQGVNAWPFAFGVIDNIQLLPVITFRNELRVVTFDPISCWISCMTAT